MGWGAGGGVFGPVCEALQNAFLVPEARKKILVVLIEALQAQDWDTEDESLEAFEDDPVVVAAFRETNPDMVADWFQEPDEYDIDLGF